MNHSLAGEKPDCNCHHEVMKFIRGEWQCAVDLRHYNQDYHLAHRDFRLAQMKQWKQSNADYVREQRQAYDSDPWNAARKAAVSQFRKKGMEVDECQLPLTRKMLSRELGRKST